MMTKQLVRVVVLTDPTTRRAETFRPGGDVPAWARKAITNPAAWGDADTADPPPEPPADPPEASEPPADPPKVSEPPADPPVLEEPPRAGRGSSLEAWQDYADALGVEYANDATRDDIITAVDTARS